MANLFSYRARPDLEQILLSNLATVLFVNALSLAASAVATTDRQREIAALIAANDQDIYGLGMVGFDLSELPWSVDAFEDDKAFLLRVVEVAKARTGWERLRVTPPEIWQRFGFSPMSSAWVG